MAVILPDWRLKGGGFDGAASGSGIPFEEVPSGPKDGVNTVFYLSFTPWLGFLQLFLNGVEQSKFVPRFSLSGRAVTFAIAPKATDELYCWYFRGPGSPNTSLTARGFGNVGSAITDKIDYGNSSLYQLQADMSFGAWVKLSSAASGSIVWRGFADSSPTPADNECFNLSPLASGSKWNIHYRHEHGSGGDVPLTFAAQLASDKWYYVAFSRDSVNLAVTLWVGDGVTIAPITTLTYGNNPDNGAGPNNRLLIGNFAGDSTFTPNALNGAVQQHYIWNRQTTIAEQILAMATNPPTSGLVLACSMGNSPEIDTSGNGGSGIVTGTLLVAGH